MIESVSLTDGATLTGVVGAAAAVLKYGGQIVAIFARMEIYHKTTSEALQQVNERLARIENVIAAGNTVPIKSTLTLERSTANG